MGQAGISGAGVIALFFTAILLLLALSGARPVAQVPALAGFNIRGGLNLSPEFAALLTGLIESGPSFDRIGRADFAELVRGLLNDETVRTGGANQPRLKILDRSL